MFLTPAIVVEANVAMPVPPTTIRSAGMLRSAIGLAALQDHGDEQAGDRPDDSDGGIRLHDVPVRSRSRAAIHGRAPVIDRMPSEITVQESWTE